MGDDQLRDGILRLCAQKSDRLFGQLRSELGVEDHDLFAVVVEHGLGIEAVCVRFKNIDGGFHVGGSFERLRGRAARRSQA